VFAELVNLFVEAKTKRQGIMVMHNANLVINTDADQIIWAQAVFQGAPDDPAAIAARMDTITAKREASQPIREKTGGSTDVTQTIKRWKDMSGTARDSGLYTKDQMTKIDAVMDDISRMLEIKEGGANMRPEQGYKEARNLLGTLGNMVGWTSGGAAGAYVGRNVLLKLSDSAKKEVEAMIVDMAMNPETIDILSKKLTPRAATQLQKIAASEYTPAVERAISALVGSEMAEKKPNPFSMRPMGY
jgi:hypothetical protein